MANPYSSSSHSPPPLQHPVPTHPAFIPDPPSTPVSPDGYMRFTSSPPQPPPQGQHQQTFYAQNLNQRGAGQPFVAGQYGNTSGYQHFSGTGAPQAPLPSQQQQQQQQQQGIFGINPAQFGVDPAAAQFGYQLGHRAVAAGQDYMQKNFGGHIPVPLLKHHFNVSNSYVLQKLRLVLFPWRHKAWKRNSRVSDQGQSQWLPPREDLNSPDLYIPVMSLVTYILLVALHSGLKGNFRPEVLGGVATRSLVVVGIEFLFIKLGCYLLNITGSSPVTDLVSYGGYKFVGVIATIVVGLITTSRTIYLLAFVYAFGSNGFFLLRALKYVVLPDPRDTTQQSMVTLSPPQRTRRIWFLFAVAASQIFYMGMLVRV